MPHLGTKTRRGGPPHRSKLAVLVVQVAGDVETRGNELNACIFSDKEVEKGTKLTLLLYVLLQPRFGDRVRRI